MKRLVENLFLHCISTDRARSESITPTSNRFSLIKRRIEESQVGAWNALQYHHGDIISCKTSFSGERSLVETLSISARPSITNGRNEERERKRERERADKQAINHSRRWLSDVPRVARTNGNAASASNRGEKNQEDPFEDGGRERRIHKSWRESLVRETIVEKYPRARYTHNRRD